jgi:hypothetical protein
MGIFKKTIAVSAIALSTTVLSTGIFPVNIAGLQNSQPASASANYQRKNGLAGEYKYIKVCNNPSGRTVDVVFEASQEGAIVQGISINLLAKRKNNFSVSTPTQGGAWLAYRTYNYNWERDHYFRGSSGRFFSYHGAGFATSFEPWDDVKFGTQTYTNNGIVYDLGGIINLGKIPDWKCRTYDDGRYY